MPSLSMCDIIYAQLTSEMFVLMTGFRVHLIILSVVLMSIVTVDCRMTNDCFFDCLFVCLFVWLSVCLFVCLFVWLAVCLSVCLFVCLFVELNIRYSSSDLLTGKM